MRLWRRLLGFTVGFVLSIGKLAVGQERYYEQQVAQGLDDYFTGRGESPGRWLGRGAVDLGLRGTVEDGELSLLMAGRDPRTGRMLREQPVKVAALDLTFSAPKSVSVLHGVADERIASALVACHEEAVEAALAYLEDTAVLVSRRTAGGLTLQSAGGFVTAAFRHRMSRALDPQLHTHCVSANLARGVDGRWTALHHPSLFRAAQTAGYLYQAHLRALVAERLGLEWGQVRKGAAELDEIDPVVLDEFSQRRHEMRRAAEEGGIGLGSKAASQAAALATRSRKQYGIETGSWREEVRARAAEHGLDRAGCRRIEGGALRTLEQASEPTRVENPRAERLVGDRLAGPEGLTELQNTFDRRAVLRALAQDAQQGARIPTLLERGDRFADRRDVLRTEHGELTTAELVGVERRLIAAAQGRASQGVGQVDEGIVKRVLADHGWWLTEEQRKAVEATVSSGHGVQVIEALAGTGKTHTAGVLARVYAGAGYEVVGVAPTGRAVRELVEQAAIPSRTLDAVLSAIERGGALPAGGVLVLDEAGMAPTRQTAALLEAAQDAGCKVVAIGDPGQLHSVQAGGWMRAVGRRVGTLRLSEVMRQRDPSERRALAALHEGNPKPWLSWAREHERVALAPAAELLECAVTEWRSATIEHGLGAAVLVARDNDTRRALNHRARAVLAEQGELGDQRSFGPLQVAAGDRVICRRNDGLIDVDNGTRGSVRAIDDMGVLLETDSGNVRRLPAGYVSEHVEHAYALTGHAMQGGTVESAFVLAAPHELTKGWSYTALSRARASTRLFVLCDAQNRDRDEVAPGERTPELTDNELYSRLARYMCTRDDEELAVEQLIALSERVEEPAFCQEVDEEEHREAVAQRAEAPPPGARTVEVFRAAAAHVRSLEERLKALDSPEARRLVAAEGREAELAGRRAELLKRAEQIPPATRIPFATDRYATERENLARAVDGVDAELRGVSSLRSRLVAEVGQSADIRSQSTALEREITEARKERDNVMNQLVDHELASTPLWAMTALGERPTTAGECELWDRAVRGLARYRLEHDVVGDRSALGEPPTDSALMERYEQARATLERARHELGFNAMERGVADAPALPSDYVRLFGPQRVNELEQALAEERDLVRRLTDDKLSRLAATSTQAVSQLDRRAAEQAVRLEREHAHHREVAEKQRIRAAQLEVQAEALGWRAHSQRERLRHDAELHRQHAGRHAADAERIELELHRLREAGRHPDQWITDHGQEVVLGLAAAAELAHRRSLEIQDQVELALADPPAYVRELLGDRPASGIRLAQEWERLVEQIERHRLTYDINLDRRSPLGPDPSEIARVQRGRYQEQRLGLAADIEHYREEIGLPEHEQTRQITCELVAALDREP